MIKESTLMLIRIVFMLLLLTGCATITVEPAPTPTPTPVPDPAPAVDDLDLTGVGQAVDSPCREESGTTFEGWQEWTKVNEEPIQGHGSAWATIYVDDLAETTYLAALAPYPECAKIVKIEYSRPAATNVYKVTVMVKLPSGFDPENNDWWYGAYDPLNATWEERGIVTSCINCHKRVIEEDYLFSVEVLEAANE